MPLPAFAKKKLPGDMEPEEPDALDMPPPKAKRSTTVSVTKAPPNGASGAPGIGAAAAPPYRPPREAAPPMEEEGMAEGGDYGEDFGQKLAADIDSVGQAHGMSTQQGRAYAANLFGAVADCLTRAAGGGGGEAPAEEEAVTETEEIT